MTEKPRENPAPRHTGRQTPPSSPTIDHRKRVDLHVVKNDEDDLNEGLEETFPGSDPVSATRRGSD